MKKITLLLLVSIAIIDAFAQKVEGIDSMLQKLPLQKEDSAKADNLIDIALVYNMNGKGDSAVYYYKQALALSERIGFERGICVSHASLGDVSVVQTDYENAMHEFVEAMKVAERSNNLKMQGFLNRNMGAVYLLQDRPDLAITKLQAAEKIFLQRRDTMGTLALMPDIANCYESMGQKEKGLAYIEKGFIMNEAFGRNEKLIRPFREGLLHNRIVLDYIYLNFVTTPEMAQKGLQRAEPLWDTVNAGNNDYNKQLLSNVLSHYYLKTGKNEKALEFAEISLSKVLDHEDYAVKKDLYEVISAASYATGKYQKAYDNLMVHNGFADSLYKIENREATQAIETKYQTEKKEQQIISLNKEKKDQRIITGISIGAFIIALGLLLFALRANRLQKKLFVKEKELQRKEMEKRMFELEQTALRAQMNPHFIFNSLNSVQRFVINNDVEGVNQYLSTFANLIRQTLENSGKQLIPLKDELKYLETYLRLEQMRGNDKFKYLIDINPDIDTEETYIPNMIIQPYLENSIIHGMAGKTAHDGLINLTISKNHKLTCIVEDNGEGIIASKSYKKIVTADHESMGTAITEKRIEMFNTVNSEKIELEVLDKSELSKPESGTRIMIKFPLNPMAN